MTPTVTVFAPLQFTVEATPDDYVVNYRIFSIGGYTANAAGEYVVPIYDRAGSLSNMDSVEDLSLAEPFIVGSVKWDGCSNWSFNTEACMHHACDKESLGHIGQILMECWEMTSTLCPNWLDRVAR